VFVFLAGGDEGVAATPARRGVATTFAPFLDTGFAATQIEDDNE
jgi:hypothetical protein